jgi:hypothetical protein
MGKEFIWEKYIVHWSDYRVTLQYNYSVSVFPSIPRMFSDGFPCPFRNFIPRLGWRSRWLPLHLERLIAAVEKSALKYPEWIIACCQVWTLRRPCHIRPSSSPSFTECVTEIYPNFESIMCRATCYCRMHVDSGLLSRSCETNSVWSMFRCALWLPLP